MPVAEPMTVLTDLALAALAAVLGTRLARADPAPARFWAAAFLVLVPASLAGVVVHGFSARLGLGLRSALWQLVYAAIGVATLLMLAGAVLFAAPRSCRNLPRSVPLLVLLGVLYPVLRGDPRWLAGCCVTLLVVLLALGIHRGILRGEAFARWVLAGTLVSLAGGFALTARLAPHPAFNHNDLFHVLQMAGLFCFYRAARVFAAGPAPAA